MYLARFARNHPVAAGLLCFVLGGAMALLGVWFFAPPRETVRVVEVERVVEKVVEKPVEKIVEKVVVKKAEPRREDLIVMQKGVMNPSDSDLGEYFVEETRKLPGVAQVWECVIDLAEVLPAEAARPVAVVLGGWKPDHFGYEDMDVTAGRKLQPGDRRKVMLGARLAENLSKNVGDEITFGRHPDQPYEVVGVFKGRNGLDSGGAVVSFEDAQALTGRRVSGFAVRVRRLSADPAPQVEAVRVKIEALRDPKNPKVRLSAEVPD